MTEDALVPDPQSNESDAMAVRLVEWNIVMGLPKKADLLAPLKPTIAVLPECAELSKSMPIMERLGATGGQWVGSLSNQGTWRVHVRWLDAGRVDDSYDPDYPWLPPLHVRGPR